MNKRIEYNGSAINIPDVISGIQTISEDYFETVVNATLTKGVLRGSSSPPTLLYMNGDVLTIGNVYIVFLDKKIVYTTGTVKADCNTLTPGAYYNIYASITTVEAGVQKKVTNKFVYNADLLDSYPSQINEEVEWEVTTSTDANKIFLGTILYNGSIYTIDQTGMDQSQLAVAPAFNDNQLILNSNESSGSAKIVLKTSGEDMTAEFDGDAITFDTVIKALDPVVDTDLTTKSWVVDYIDEVHGIPDIPNFRISHINGTNNESRDAEFPEGTYTIEKGSDSRMFFNVTFEWGWDRFFATGGDGGMAIIDADLQVIEDELVGYYLYHTGKAQSYEIVSNTETNGSDMTSVELIDGDGSIPDLTGFNLASGYHGGKIHSNVHKHNLVLTPMIDTALQDDAALTFTTGRPLTMSKKVKLPAGIRIMAEVNGDRGSRSSEFIPLPDGSYTKYSSEQSYGKGDGSFIVKHAQLTNISYEETVNDVVNTIFPSDISTISTDNGFRVALKIETGEGTWDDAEEFEIAWSTEPGDVNFSDKTSYNSKVIPRYVRFTSISTTVSALHSVAIKPLIGGIYAGVQRNKTVTSGSAGKPPVVSAILTLPIDLQTYSGDLTYTAGVVTCTTVVRSADGIQAVTVFPSSIVGSVITIDGDDFKISYHPTGLILVLVALNGGVAPPGSISPTTFEINTSKRGRKITRFTIPSDVRLTKLSYDCDDKIGEDVNLRVWQEGRETSNDSINIHDDDRVFSSAADVLLSQQYGSLNIVVDLWDDASSGALNKGLTKGTLVIYAQPWSYSVDGHEAF